MTYLFDPRPPVALPIANSSHLYPVRRIYCVGRNYADHAREMGHDPDREEPFFFAKNAENLVVDGRFPYPSATHDVHHEVELVVALQEGGTNIPTKQALETVFGYAVGIDMTRRDLQGLAKKAGRPWEAGKAFEHSAPIGPIHPVSELGHVVDKDIWLSVDGEMRQSAKTNQLIWSVAEVISKLSELFELAPGDLIFTGTPAGVGPVMTGQTMMAGIEGLGEITVDVVERAQSKQT